MIGRPDVRIVPLARFDVGEFQRLASTGFVSDVKYRVEMTESDDRFALNLKLVPLRPGLNAAAGDRRPGLRPAAGDRQPGLNAAARRRVPRRRRNPDLRRRSHRRRRAG